MNILDLPATVASLDTVPVEDHECYERDPSGGYRLALVLREAQERYASDIATARARLDQPNTPACSRCSPPPNSLCAGRRRYPPALPRCRRRGPSKPNTSWSWSRRTGSLSS